jgi:Zn-dependent peptidase ImmA (M78 family)
MTVTHIYDIVRKLLKKHDTRDPFAIAERLGVHVMANEDFILLKGMYKVIKRNRFIILNASLPKEISGIVCAHELGHDSLHRDFAKSGAWQEFVLYDMRTRPEYEANIFAAGLLLDEGKILEYGRLGYDVEQIASAMNTDINLVLIKMEEMSKRGYGCKAACRPRADFLGK